VGGVWDFSGLEKPSAGGSMISPDDKEAITQIARRYQVTRMLVFGSSADPTREGRDIDLAVEGIPPEEFFRFYGDLLFSLSRPVDLIDLSRDNKLTRIVRREGILLYEFS
jgi:predicted nucleotidyltransferase